MNESEPMSEIRNYYESKQLPDDRVDRILNAGKLAAEVRRWRMIAVVAASGMILMAAVTVAVFVRRQPAPHIVNDPPNVNLDPNQSFFKPDEVVQIANRPSESAPQYRLVAFRSHDDNCPHCRRTGSVYAALKNNLDHKQLLFNNFALNDADQRAKTMSEIADLNLTSMVAGRAETAFLVLLGPSGMPFTQYDPARGVSNIRQSIVDIVDQ